MAIKRISEADLIDDESRKEEYELREAEYNRAVKHNLRSFLSTKNYRITGDGTFERKENDAIVYNSKQDLCTELINYLWESSREYMLKQPADKLTKLLSDAKPKSLDPYFVSIICRAFSFPPEYVYSKNKISPERAQEIMHTPKLAIKPFAPLSRLTHSSYYGLFYGYTYEHHPDRTDKLLKFTLSIYEKEDMTTEAEYVFYDKNNRARIFRGVPFYIADRELISIEMTSDNNTKYQHLQFNGRPYGETFTYKSGICTRSSSASRENEPDAKSFILTSRELPRELESTIIPGLLKMSGESFYITASALKKIEAENKAAAELHRDYPRLFQLVDENVYCIKEYALLSGIVSEKIIENNISAFECLTIMKAASLAPDKIIYRDSDADFHFFSQLKKCNQNYRKAKGE